MQIHTYNISNLWRVHDQLIQNRSNDPLIILFSLSNIFFFTHYTQTLTLWRRKKYTCTMFHRIIYRPASYWNGLIRLMFINKNDYHVKMPRLSEQKRKRGNNRQITQYSLIEWRNIINDREFRFFFFSSFLPLSKSHARQMMIKRNSINRNCTLSFDLFRSF